MIIQILVLSYYFNLLPKNSWVITYDFVESYVGGNSLITPRNTINKTQGNFPLVAQRKYKKYYIDMD